MFSPRALGWLFAGLAAFVAAVALAWPELQYLLFAQTVDAQVAEVRELVESRRRSDELMLQVEYVFADGPITRRERDRVPISWPRPTAGATTAVEYLPGQQLASRLAGHRNLVTPTLLFIAMAFFSGFIIPMIGWQKPEPVTPGT